MVYLLFILYGRLGFLVFLWWFYLSGVGINVFWCFLVFIVMYFIVIDFLVRYIFYIGRNEIYGI